MVEGELVRKKREPGTKGLGDQRKKRGDDGFGIRAGVQATRRLLVVIGEARKSNLEESQEKSRATDAPPVPPAWFCSAFDDSPRAPVEIFGGRAFAPCWLGRSTARSRAFAVMEILYETTRASPLAHRCAAARALARSPSSHVPCGQSRSSIPKAVDYGETVWGVTE